MPYGVKFAENVVEEEDGVLVGGVTEDFAFGEFEREGGGTRLAL